MNIIKFWEHHGAMTSIWIGAIVMGTAYLLGLKTPEESSAFIIGQIALGGFGLAREIHLKRKGFIPNQEQGN